MTIPIPSFAELLKKDQELLTANTGITNFSESSIAGALLKVYISHILDLYYTMSTLESQSNLSTATGTDLDLIGDMFGVKRLPSKNATTAGMGSSILFTNNSSLAVTIPYRTRLWATGNTDIAYYTNYAITLQPGTEGYSDVTAVNPGAGYNVSINTLNTHNLNNPNVTVTNILPIENGYYQEDDENYRYRIANALTIQQGANETSIRMQLMELPGIKDVFIHPLARGTGTVDVTILSTDRTVSQTLLDEAQSLLDSIVAFGISGKVNAPIERPIDIKIQLSLRDSLTASTQRSIVSAAVRMYIDNLPAGDGNGTGNIIFYELVQRIMDASSGILNANIILNVDNQPSLNVDQKLGIGEIFFVRSIEVL